MATLTVEEIQELNRTSHPDQGDGERLLSSDEIRQLNEETASEETAEAGQPDSPGEALLSSDEVVQLNKATALRENVEEYDLLRRRWSLAKDMAAKTNEPAAKYKALAAADYLRDRMVSSAPKQEDLEEFLATSRLAGHMPGKKEGLMAGLDVFDVGTSPVARPAFAGLSASADIGALHQKSSNERADWISKLHPDDPRGQLYWEIHEQIDKAEREGRGDISAELKKGSWATLLAATYELPGIDPYGGGPPRPWQEVGRGGSVEGGPAATTTDILVRGLLSAAPGAGDKYAPAVRAKVHGASEYLERPFEALWAATDPDETMKEAWARSGEEAYKVWSGHPDADPYEGSFLPSLFFTVAPDLLISAPAKLTKAFVETASGALTKSGDNAVREAVSRANSRVSESVRTADDAVTKEGLDAILDETRSVVETAYSSIGDAAQKGHKIGVAAGEAAPKAEFGLDFADAGLFGAKAPSPRVGVVHVDLDDAVTLGRADDGALRVDLDMSKARVLYDDDPLVRSAKQDALMRGLSASEKSTLTRAMEDLGVDKFTSSSQIYADLSNRGLGRNLALVGALGFGGGLLAPGEDAEWGERFMSGVKAGLGGVVGGAVVLGAGRGIGTVVDSAGRKVAGFGYAPGSVRALEISNAPLAGKAEKFRAAMPGFKSLKPWAHKTIDANGEVSWKPIEAADLVGDHQWARHKFLMRRKRISEAKLRADTQRSIYNVMKGVYTKEEREIVTYLAESLGQGSKEADTAMKLIDGMRKHLNKALKFLPDEKVSVDDVAGPKVKGPKVRGPKAKGPKVKGPRVKGPKVKSVAQQQKEAADELRRLLDDDPFVPAGGRSIGDVVRRYAEKAVMIDNILRQTLGAASKGELKAMRKVQRNLDAAIARSRGALDEEEFVKAVDSLSPLEARRAAKAFRKSGGKADPRYADLSDAGKKAVEGTRGFFESMYRLLKAEGGLPHDWSLEKFLDEMEVGGYVHHFLTKGGSKAISALRSRYAERFAGIDTALDVVKKRHRTGTVEEINEGVRRDIAEMIYREKHKLADDDIVSDSALSELIVEQGLDNIKFFETDASKIMMEYSGKVSKWASNFKYLENLRRMFPGGDNFAAIAAEQGLVAAAASAAKAGFRRVDGVTHLRAVAGAEPWAGFKEHAQELRDLLLATTASKRGEAVYEFLNKRGVDIGDSRVKLNVEVLAGDLYLPHVYADVVETLSVPSRMELWASGDDALAKAIGTWDDVTNYFKVMTTIFAPAFHGRNFISNVVTNTMTHGWDAVKPSNQIDSVYLMRAPEDAEWALEGVTTGGQRYSIKKTVREWREELKDQGIIVDNFDITDSIRRGGRPNYLRTGLVAELQEADVSRGEFMTALMGRGEAKRLLRPSTYRVPAYTGALGASVGGAVGYSSSDKPEDRLRKVVAGVLVGGMAGMGTGSMYDLFLRDPAGAARHAAARAAGQAPDDLKGLLIARPEFWQNVKPALSAGFDEWLDIVGGTGKEGFVKTALHAVGGTAAGRVGLVGGAVGGAGGALTATQEEDAMWRGLVGAAAGLLGVGGTKMWGEGASVIAGGMGRKIEEQAKIASYLAGRKKGLSADASADIVHKTLFDYGDLSKFERHWLRRVFPFYTWSSKNATALQPWLLQNRPKSYSFLAKFLDAADGDFSSEHDMAYLPDHMKYRAILNMGFGKIIAGFGLPQEDMAELFKVRELGRSGFEIVPSGLIGRLHPALQLFYKFVAKKDPYYNVDLDKVRSARDVRYLPPFMKEYVGYREVEKTRTVAGKKQTFTSYEVGHFPTKEGLPGESGALGASRLALLRAFPAWRLVAEYNKVMTDTFMGGVRAESGARATAGERFLATTTGVKPYAVDWNRLEMYAYKDFEQRLLEELMSRGEAGDLPILYNQPRSAVDELEILRSLGLYE